MNEPSVIELDSPDPETARPFAEADRHPVLVQIAGTMYRIERVEQYLYYHPEERQGRQDAGGRALSREQYRRIVREAKPKHLPTEYGPESRYGRDSYSNSRYNDALDEYEAALLKVMDDVPASGQE